eukprot:741917-Hanusia_phi.AAC.2
MASLSPKNVAWALNAAKKLPHPNDASLFLAAAAYLPQMPSTGFGAQNLALVSNALAWKRGEEEVKERDGERGGALKARMEGSGCVRFLQQAAREVSEEEWKKEPRALAMFVQAAVKLEMMQEESLRRFVISLLKDKTTLQGEKRRRGEEYGLSRARVSDAEGGERRREKRKGGKNGKGGKGMQG